MAEEIILERTYNVPLRKEFLKVPKYKRAKKAVTALKQFLVKHMKSDNVKIGKYLNDEIWKHGIKNPPHHVKLNAVKDKDGLITAELVGAPVDKKEEEETKKEEEPKVEEKEVEQVSHNKEESIEITKTNVDESNVMEKDVSADIKEVGQETSTVESKTDKDQQKLDEVKITEDNDYDISKEEKTVNEVMGEHNPKTEEDVFTSSHESDDLLKENPETHQRSEERRVGKECRSRCSPDH